MAQMNIGVVLALRAARLNPNDPLVRLSLRVVKKSADLFEEALVQLANPTWVFTTADKIASPDQRLAADAAGGMQVFADRLAKLIASDPGRAKKLFSLKALL